MLSHIYFQVYIFNKEPKVCVAEGVCLRAHTPAHMYLLTDMCR